MPIDPHMAVRPTTKQAVLWDYRRGLRGNAQRRSTNKFAARCYKYSSTTDAGRLHVPFVQIEFQAGRRGPLPHRAPLQQASAGARHGVLEVVGADPQGIAEPPCPFGYNVFAKNRHGALLLHRR